MGRLALPLCALLPASAVAADKATAPRVDFGAELAQVMGGLALVLALVLLLAWLVRRVQHNPLGGARNMRLVGGIALGSRERIVVVQVGETQLVVGVAPGVVRTLHVLEKPLQGVMDDEKDESGFGARLARLMNGGGQ